MILQTDLQGMNRKIIIFMVILGSTVNMNFTIESLPAKVPKKSQSVQSFSNILDNFGKANIPYSIKIQNPFFIQAFILYDSNWRTIPIFFNENSIWIDLGPRYKKTPYLINILTN